MTFEEWAKATLQHESSNVVWALQKAWQAAIAEEREACAAMIERTDLSGAPDEVKSWLANMLMAYVDAIRARSNVEFSGTPAASSPESPLEHRVWQGD